MIRFEQHRSDVDEFLNVKRFALVGVSRDSKHISRKLYEFFTDKGYEVLPVNPAADNIDGKRCYANVGEIEPRVNTVLVTLSQEHALEAVEACVSTGIDRIWVYGIAGAKDVDMRILALAMENKVKLVAGFCPFMFAEGSGFPHKLHGAIWKLIGLYPK